MANPIVGQCMLYLVQMVYAAHAMIFIKVLIEKIPCMYFIGLWVYTIVLCTMYVLPMYVWG